MLIGKHLIAGEWVAGATTFRSSPAHGEAHDFCGGHARAGGPRLRGRRGGLPGLCRHHARGRARLSWTRIADEIEARGAEITAIGTQETGLPAARLEGERGRTTGQLRLFAAISARATIWTGATMRRCRTASPLPRPDICA